MRKQWIFIHMPISDPVGKVALSHGFRRAVHFLGCAQSVWLDIAALNLGNRAVAPFEKIQF